MDCKLCVHKPVCDLWRSNECQDASCFSDAGCDFFLEERRWIPVTERLPEDGETVLTYKNGIIEVHVYEKKRNGWISWQGNWFWSMATVSHWMPLPEPPKEDA